MQKDKVSTNLSNLAFDFFYWFSRFEFALKENGYLKFHWQGANAEAGWEEFTEKWATKYVVSKEAQLLLQKPPERQIVVTTDKLAWKPVGLDDCKSDLAKIVRLVKTVRNNLFHGGKHGGESWDNPKRSEELLTFSIAVLNELAQLASLEADYEQFY